ncbi:MAG: hypothetical protein GY757_37155 [bacterium]|nr:hypothetical protein [bacterium]
MINKKNMIYKDLAKNKGVKTLAIVLTVMFFFTGLSLQALRQTTENKETLKRFALVMGANNGGPKRVKLQYAVSDARAFMKVLKTLGGVETTDGSLLEEPDREAFFNEIEATKEKIGKARTAFNRVEILLYYSGHSDEGSLLLGNEKLSYKELRDVVDSLDADVRIAILDSCASGAFTRLKGGKLRAPFMMDTANNMKGSAFMTSSSLDEASQESERLKGSFFTHNLVTGLRGAADMSRDGQITLNEAYHFAFNETLAQTEKTMSGPQHPNYNIRMAGTGDVVMTDIRKSPGLLLIPAAIGGKLFIRTNEEKLVVEFDKLYGREMELGMEPGKYSILNIKKKYVYEAEIHLKDSEPFALHPDMFQKQGKLKNRIRGGKLRPFSQVPKRNLFVLAGLGVDLTPGGMDVSLTAGMEYTLSRHFFAQGIFNYRPNTITYYTSSEAFGLDLFLGYRFRLAHNVDLAFKGGASFKKISYGISNIIFYATDFTDLEYYDQALVGVVGSGVDIGLSRKLSMTWGLTYRFYFDDIETLMGLRLKL